MREIHIFPMVFDDFQKLCFLCMPKKSVVFLRRLEGVLRVLWVHGALPKSAFTFFLAPGGSFGAAHVRTMATFEVNPAVELKVLFFVF